MSRIRLLIRTHALKRMAQRAISEDDVRRAIETGESIETYPEDKPFPSRLVLGWSNERPIHVVVADNRADGEQIVITVYEPGLDRWEHGFVKRKKP